MCVTEITCKKPRYESHFTGVFCRHIDTILLMFSRSVKVILCWRAAAAARTPGVPGGPLLPPGGRAAPPRRAAPALTLPQQRHPGSKKTPNPKLMYEKVTQYTDNRSNYISWTCFITLISPRFYFKKCKRQSPLHKKTTIFNGMQYYLLFKY